MQRAPVLNRSVGAAAGISLQARRTPIAVKNSCSSLMLRVSRISAVRRVAGQQCRAAAGQQQLPTQQQRLSRQGRDFAATLEQDVFAPSLLLQSSPLASLLLLGSIAPANVVADLGEGLETPVQLLYLVTLLGFLVVGAYLVVRQVLIRRELEEAAKVLGERVRTGEAIAEDYFELGVILLRKKLFTQATKNLEKAKKMWDGEPQELAQVHNALGYAYFNMSRYESAVSEYRKAVELQPGYVTAWNNLANVFEQNKDWQGAYDAYMQALSYAPDNSVARQRSEALKNRISRLGV